MAQQREATFDSDNVVDPILPIDENLDTGDIVQLSRKHGGTTFAPKRMDMLKIKFHGDVFSGPVNWFFAYSKNDSVLKISGGDGRVYKVVMFTPKGRILRPHQTIAPFDNDSEMCSYSEDSLIENPKDKAINRAKSLATREIDPEEEFRWY